MIVRTNWADIQHHRGNDVKSSPSRLQWSGESHFFIPAKALEYPTNNCTVGSAETGSLLRSEMVKVTPPARQPPCPGATLQEERLAAPPLGRQHATPQPQPSSEPTTKASSTL